MTIRHITNQVINTSSADAVYRIKEHFKLYGATVPRSGDGQAAFGTSDVVTHSSTGANGLNVNKSWFVVAINGRQYCFQRGSSADNWRVKYSAAAGFTGGSATQCAAATDEQLLYAGGTDAAPTGAGIFATNYGTAGAPSKLAVWFDDAAPYGWGFEGWNGGGTVQCGFAADPLLAGTYPVEDVDPIAFHCATSAGFGSQVAMFSEGISPINGWLKKGLAGAGWVQLNAPTMSVSTRILVPGAMPVNPHTDKDEGDIMFYKRGSGLAAPVGHKGASTYLRWQAQSRPSWTTLTRATTKDAIVINQVTVPWGGVDHAL
jgi:hypothetical protein